MVARSPSDTSTRLEPTDLRILLPSPVASMSWTVPLRSSGFALDKIHK